MSTHKQKRAVQFLSKEAGIHVSTTATHATADVLFLRQIATLMPKCILHRNRQTEITTVLFTQLTQKKAVSDNLQRFVSLDLRQSNYNAPGM